MAFSSKYIKLNANVLMEYIFNNENYISENYTVVENIKDGTRTFLSTSNNNKIENNFFNVDSVLRRFSPIDLQKFNFLQKEDYFTQPIQYDILRLHFPISYTFDTFLGFYLSVYAYSFENNTKYHFTNYFFDKTINYVTSSGFTFESSFLFDEQMWGKYIEIQIPSVDFVSNQRYVTSTTNEPIDNTINNNLTRGEGLSLSTPIFINFQFLTAKETTFGTTYYSVGDLYATSQPKVPEYRTLAVEIQESTQGDFFEIYATFDGSNENVDDYVYSMEVKGRRVRFEYTVMLVEENLPSNPQKFLVADNFPQKILYRPIITFSNTTAAIDVTLSVIDIVDNTTITRKTSIGLTKNLFKYGKRLARINLDTNVIKPKIYNAKSMNQNSISQNTTQKVTVPTLVYYPVLNDRYKISVSSSLSTSQGIYQGMGKLNILLTPFDNVIEFWVAKGVDSSNNPEPFDIAKLNSNGKMMLVFRSDTDQIQKEVWDEATSADKVGSYIYRIDQIEIPLLKKISKSSRNFFLVLNGGDKAQTLLYQGTFSFSETAVFK